MNLVHFIEYAIIVLRTKGEDNNDKSIYRNY